MDVSQQPYIYEKKLRKVNLKNLIFMFHNIEILTHDNKKFK